MPIRRTEVSKPRETTLIVSPSTTSETLPRDVIAAAGPGEEATGPIRLTSAATATSSVGPNRLTAAAIRRATLISCVSPCQALQRRGYERRCASPPPKRPGEGDGPEADGADSGELARD